MASSCVKTVALEKAERWIASEIAGYVDIGR
jgi:hypothetical protein